VHQTIIVAAGFCIVQMPWSIGVKLILIMFITTVGSWLSFEIVRRTRLTRLLFGLKEPTPTMRPALAPGVLTQ